MIDLRIISALFRFFSAIGVGFVANFCTIAVAGPEVIGPLQNVYEWETASCERWDIPDAPARAWRDGEGVVHLIAGAERTRASTGASLDTVARRCSVLHRGAENDDPASFDDRSWLASLFATGGTRVEALAHVEYHGHLRPERCPAADYAACWFNAIAALESDDGGASFSRADDGSAVVATLPYRYDGANGSRYGYFNPSNILRVGEHVFVFVFAEAYGVQRRGACLLRRPVAGGVGDWRAWDGNAFTVRFADPYREAVRDPRDHVCAPLHGIASTISTVVRRGADGPYLAVTPMTQRTPDGRSASGIFWMTSNDLINWSAPRMLFEAPLLWRRDCEAPTAFAYPSLIDEASPGSNFEEVDGDFWLYLTEARLDADCRAGPHRNLVRLRVKWPPG